MVKVNDRSTLLQYYKLTRIYNIIFDIKITIPNSNPLVTQIRPFVSLCIPGLFL